MLLFLVFSELNIGTDIFQTESFEDEDSKYYPLEEQYFHEYGRFFGFHVGIGHTTFTHMRRKAYVDIPPTLHLSLRYFFNLHLSCNVGFEYSFHQMMINTPVNGYDDPNDLLGRVSTYIPRIFLAIRYAPDVSKYSRILLFSNPYITFRGEYVYHKNIFPDRTDLSTEITYDMGIALGFGIEIPLKKNNTFFNLEFLFHMINFSDQYTINYRKISTSSYGYDDLQGYTLSLIGSLNICW